MQKSPRSFTSLSQISDHVDKTIRHKFYQLGELVADRPGATIVISLLVAAICATGYVNFKIQVDNVKLYTNQDARSFDDKDYAEETWGFGYRFNDVFLVHDDKGTNVLTKDALLTLLDQHDIVFSHTVEYEGDTITTESLCRRVNGQCWRESVLDAFAYNRTAIESLADDTALLAAINSWDFIAVSGLQLSTDAVLSGVVRDSGNQITSAEAMRFGFQFNNEEVTKGGLTRDYKAQKWEIKLKAPLLDDSGVDDSDYHVTLKTLGGFDEISDGAIEGDVGVIPLGYVLMIVFASLVLGRRNMVHSQASLALFSVLSVAVSTFAAFGLVSSFMEFSLVVNGAILLLLGLGIDDAFVLVNSYRLTPSDMEPRERIANALSDAGSAILVTSITDFAAFLAGSLSTVPAIQVFCMFSAFGVLFDFLYQITFFYAFFVIDVRRQSASRMDWICCLKGSPENDCISSSISGQPVPFDHTDRGRLTMFTMTSLSNMVLSPIGRVVTLVTASVLFGGGMYCATLLESEFSQNWFIPDNGNYIREALDVESEYFGARGFVQTMYFKEGDYFAATGDLDRIETDFPTIPHLLQDTVFNWYPAFKSWHNTTYPSSSLSSASFAPRLREFTESAEGSPFVGNILISADNMTVMATRIQFASDFATSEDIIQTMDAARDLAGYAEDSLDARTYSLAYIFMDGLKTMKDELFQNLLVAGAAVFVVCALLLAHVPLAFLVLVMVALIDIELLGYAYLVGFSYNSVTVINGLVTVGLAVDYNAHIAHAFRHGSGSRLDRARFSLNHIGGAVFTGGISTFLAVLPMAAAQSYIFEVFFRMLSFMVLCSLFHGLCVLPVILSFVGPKGTEDGEDDPPSVVDAKKPAIQL